MMQREEEFQNEDIIFTGYLHLAIILVDQRMHRFESIAVIIGVLLGDG
jgi:hypothetical protein